VARAAATAGIGWVALNCNPDYISELRRSARVPVFSLSSDHQEIGRIQGRQFSALLPRGGNVLYIQGPSETAAAKNRTAGMLSVLAPNIHLTVLRGQWTEESAYRSVTSWMKLTMASKVKIDLVGAQNDLMGMGARKVFEALSDPDERARWLGLPFTGVDGLPKTGQTWVRNGSLAATIVVPPNAGTAIQMLCDALQNGTAFPEHSYTTPESLPPLDMLAPAKVPA
jgi:ABC-type sugar transport system substrate-binding protein